MDLESIILSDVRLFKTYYFYQPNINCCKLHNLSRDGGQVGQVIIQVEFLVGQLLRGRLLQVVSIVHG